MMNCVIIDDEHLARDIIRRYIENIPYLNLIAECSNAYEAFAVLETHHVDLLFLDIQMPDISGIKLLESVENYPYIIFTTAYAEYAVEGFEKNAVDYLLKPIAPERFLKAVSKAKELYNLKTKKTQETERDYMFVKVEYQTVKIKFVDILYIEGLKDYVKIFTKNGMILTLLNIKAILAKLPKSNFVRVHKSYIVSVSAIEKIERNRIIFGNTRIPIGDSYKDDFLKHTI
ncbi:MAG: LytTR family DNA-binding domain-containing protein [Bacteroidales bacterium]|nr:LytTR family DNA-binding domain-containing protein [Bacteroidales bacterium]